MKRIVGLFILLNLAFCVNICAQKNKDIQYAWDYLNKNMFESAEVWYGLYKAENGYDKNFEKELAKAKYAYKEYCQLSTNVSKSLTQKQYKEAYHYIETGQQNQRFSHEIDSIKRALDSTLDEYFINGKSHYQNGKFQEALDNFQGLETLRKFQNNYVFSYEGQCLLMLNEYNKALESFLAGISIGDTWAPYLLALGIEQNKIKYTKRKVLDLYKLSADAGYQPAKERYDDLIKNTTKTVSATKTILNNKEDVVNVNRIGGVNKDKPWFFDLDNDNTWAVSALVSQKYAGFKFNYYPDICDNRIAIGAIVTGNKYIFAPFKPTNSEIKTSQSNDKYTIYGNYSRNYSNELDPYNEAKKHLADYKLLLNGQYVICNGISADLGLGFCYCKEMYYMDQSYEVTYNSNHEMLSTVIHDDSMWYYGKDIFSPAVRLGVEFNIPITDYLNIPIGVGYMWIPSNINQSTFDISIGILLKE